MPPREKGHSIARNPREEPRQWYPPRAPYLLHGHRVPPSRGVPLSVCYWSFDRRVRFHVFAFHPPSVGDRLKNRPAPRSLEKEVCAHCCPIFCPNSIQKYHGNFVKNSRNADKFPKKRKKCERFDKFSIRKESFSNKANERKKNEIFNEIR